MKSCREIKKENKVDISLIIDDSKTARCTLDLSNTSSEILYTLSEELSDKLNLDEKVKVKLYYQLKKKISDIKQIKKKKSSFYSKREELFNRLYYQDFEQKQKNLKKNAQTYREKMKKELEKYSFTPEINSMSNKLYKQKHEKIEDRLYRQSKKHGIIDKQLQKLLKVKAKSGEYDFTSQVDEKISHLPKTMWNNKENNQNNLEVLNDEMNNKERNLDTITEGNFNEQINNKNKLPKKHYSKGNASSYLMKYEKMHNTKTNLKDMIELSMITSTNNNNEFGQNKKDLTTVGNLSEGDFRKSSIKAFRRQNHRTHKFLSDENEPITEQNNKSDNLNFSQENNYNLTRPTYKACTTVSSNKRERRHKSINERPLISLSKNKENKKRNDISSGTYSYRPRISEKSQKIMEKRRESKDQFYKRLMLSKKISETKKSLEKMKNKSLTKSSISEQRIHTEPSRPISSYYRSGLCSDRKRVREEKNEKEMINSLKEAERKKEINNQYYFAKTNNNIENFKLNRLKNIYEIITKNKNRINFDALTENDIPIHIKEKVVIPACLMISQKGLEFNFQNFYLISSEILNNYF